MLPLASALIVVAFGIIIYITSLNEDQSVAMVEHTYRVIDVNDQLLLRIVDAETGMRGFIITGDTAYLQPYTGAADDVRARLVLLRELTADNPAQQARLDSMTALVGRRFAQLEERVAMRRSLGFDSALVALMRTRSGKAVMDSLRAVAARIEDEERTLLDARSRDLQRGENTLLWIVGAGTLLAAALAAWVNTLLSRYAASQAQLNAILQNQAKELEKQATELEAMNDALEARTAEAEEANRSKSKFLAMMSHDLRTPLNAIIGYVDLIEAGVRGPVTDAQRSDLRRVNRSSSHLLSLINQVLNFAKIEAGHLDMRVDDVSVRDVLSGVDAIVAPQAKTKQLAFSYDSCPAELHVRADREKLDQILINLVSNAIKFTPSGGSVHVGCAILDNAVELSVKDTGPGIPADHLQTVFDPFVQLDGATTPEGPHGVGLGLAISRELARGMHGKLTAESTVGAGSTFRLRLPRAQTSS